MTGPEHYREAEQLLDLAADYDKDGALTSAERCRKDALVHAMLAQAAATAVRNSLLAYTADVNDNRVTAWDRSIAPQAAQDGDV